MGMKQVLKVSLDDVKVSGELSVAAVYRNDNWGDYPYRLCQLVGRKKIWFDEYDNLHEAADGAVNAAIYGFYGYERRYWK